MNAAIYARVSDGDQHTENQLPELHACAQRNGWPALEYLESASGKLGGKRPVLAQLLADAKAGKFGVVICWKMDRFGRSVKDFIGNLQALDDAGVRFLCTSQPIDTDQRSPFGKLIMIILMAIAEFERDLIIERVRLGVKRYRKAYDDGDVGKRVHSKSKADLPPGRPRIIFRRDKVLELRKQGMSWRNIASELGVDVSTIRLSVKSAA